MLKHDIGCNILTRKLFFIVSPSHERYLGPLMDKLSVLSVLRNLALHLVDQDIE